MSLKDLPLFSGGALESGDRESEAASAPASSASAPASSSSASSASSAPAPASAQSSYRPSGPTREAAPARQPSEPEPAIAEPARLTVSEFTQQVRRTLEPRFTEVWVQGEVSNYRPAGSGHAYFSLKDEGASVAVAFFGWGARKRGFDLKDGMQVLVRGKVSVYAPRGNYQLVLDRIEPLGAGALQAAFEQLKAKLAAEGLFDSRRKRPLPAFPRRVAIVTSPSGAAVRDMINILARRAPQVEVLVIPALVQGDEAPAQVIRGLELANRHSLADVVVLARGGGSIEDLWGFNDERLARAIAASRLPVISAVGHEIDFTISDFVADLRAPTPSAAAEIVTGQWVDAVRALREARDRLRLAIVRDVQNRRSNLAHLSARVVNPRDRLREQVQRTDELFLRLERAMRLHLERRKSRVEQCMGKLDALSPLRVLERGYSMVREPGTDGALIRSAAQVRSGQELRISFYDGERTVEAR